VEAVLHDDVVDTALPLGRDRVARLERGVQPADRPCHVRRRRLDVPLVLGVESNAGVQLSAIRDADPDDRAGVTEHLAAIVEELRRFDRDELSVLVGLPGLDFRRDDRAALEVQHEVRPAEIHDDLLDRLRRVGNVDRDQPEVGDRQFLRDLRAGRRVDEAAGLLQRMRDSQAERHRQRQRERRHRPSAAADT